MSNCRAFADKINLHKGSVHYGILLEGTEYGCRKLTKSSISLPGFEHPISLSNELWKSRGSTGKESVTTGVAE